MLSGEEVVVSIRGNGDGDDEAERNLGALESRYVYSGFCR